MLLVWGRGMAGTLFRANVLRVWELLEVCVSQKDFETLRNAGEGGTSYLILTDETEG